MQAEEAARLAAEEEAARVAAEYAPPPPPWRATAFGLRSSALTDDGVVASWQGGGGSVGRGAGAHRCRRASRCATPTAQFSGPWVGSV